MELGDSRPPGRELPLPGSNRGVLSSRLLLGKWSTSKAAGGLFLLGPPYQCAPSGGRDIDSCSVTVFVQSPIFRERGAGSINAHRLSLSLSAYPGPAAKVFYPK